MPIQQPFLGSLAFPGPCWASLKPFPGLLWTFLRDIAKLAKIKRHPKSYQNCETLSKQANIAKAAHGNPIKLILLKAWTLLARSASFIGLLRAL